MNKDLPIHPAIFPFMTHLRCYVYQQGISTVALNHAGLNKPSKTTIAAQTLSNRARDVEERYFQGLITPTEVLQQAAAHYADDVIQESLTHESYKIERQTYAVDEDEELSQSQDPALQDPELEDERRTELDADEGLTDMGCDDWNLAHWKDPGIRNRS